MRYPLTRQVQPKNSKAMFQAMSCDLRERYASACSCSGVNALAYGASPNIETISRRYTLLTASTPRDTRLKNTASKTSTLLTGLSNTYSISSNATAHIGTRMLPATLRRHNDCEAVMLLAVAAASPATMSV